MARILRIDRSTPVVAADSLAPLAEGMPPTAELIPAAGGRPPIYVDGEDGHIITVISASRLAYAWLYYALHSFNVPGLAAHEWLRMIVVLIPLSAGFLFSVTGIVIGIRRLRNG